MTLKYSHRKIIMNLTQTTYPNCIALRTGKKKGISTAEAEALAPVLEKSATELKHKQKLLKYKSTLQKA